MSPGQRPGRRIWRVFDPRSWVPAPFCAVLCLLLTACGGGGGGDGTTGSPPAEISGTLAYVETECRNDTKGSLFEHESLRIRQGEGEPVTVFETPEVSVPNRGFLCPYLGAGRLGDAAVAREAFQWVNVSPDGASVVFEVTDEFSVNPKLPLNLPPEKKGIFLWSADGKGLRLLGPPSRERNFYVAPTGGVVSFGLGVAFSPSGRTIAFPDKGPDADGHEADQVVTIDVATGRRTQVTHLPPAVPPAGYPSDAPTVQIRRPPGFVDEQTISFYTSANPDDLNKDGIYLLMTIKTDGSGLDVPPTVALPGAVIEQQFIITGDKPQAFIVNVPGTPTNDPPLPFLPPRIREIFVTDEEKNVLQLTNFRRQDTASALVDVDQDHVYVAASANPPGAHNPSFNCQIFSIDRLGSDLRQLTNFSETSVGSVSRLGCGFGPVGRGCGLYFDYQDLRTRTLLFYSDCDPLGMGFNGAQIFAMRPDGSGLRQLTDAKGLVHEAQGVYSGDIPGLLAYGPYAP